MMIDMYVFFNEHAQKQPKQFASNFQEVWIRMYVS